MKDFIVRAFKANIAFFLGLLFGTVVGSVTSYFTMISIH